MGCPGLSLSLSRRAVDDSMGCPQCGHVSSEKAAKFCSQCGQKLSPAATVQGEARSGRGQRDAGMECVSFLLRHWEAQPVAAPVTAPVGSRGREVPSLCFCVKADCSVIGTYRFKGKLVLLSVLSPAGDLFPGVSKLW